jgi:uncharacterized membrane protein
MSPDVAEYVVYSPISINLIGLMSAISDIVDTLAQYFPLLILILVLLGILKYTVDRSGELINNINGIFSAT